MGYIRDNEDYYVSIGYSAERARIQAAIDERNIDYGVCNPIKAKLAAEEEADVIKEIEEKKQ
ncbi:MAG: hypothetical protein AB7L09_03255 [Nitrospira sp.]